MMFGFILMNLMNRNCRMDDLRLNSLLLNDGLNGLEKVKKIRSLVNRMQQHRLAHLVNVVVDMLSCNDRGS